MDQVKKLFSQLVELVSGAVKLFLDKDLSVYAGYGTMFIVTSVFPFIVLIISIVNLLPGYNANNVVDILLQILPDLQSIRALVISIVSNLKNQSGGLLASAAALTTLWSASKGINAIQRGLNKLEPVEFKITVEKDADLEEMKLTYMAKAISLARKTVKRVLFTLLLIVMIPALLVFEMLGDNIVKVTGNVLEKILPDEADSVLSSIESIFQASSIVVVLFVILAFLLIYAYLPVNHRTLKSQLPGALFTTLCMLAFTKLFSIFIPRFYHSSGLYGSMASLFLLLLWLWIVVMIVFGGGVLNRTLELQNQDEDNENEETSASV